MTDQKNFDLKKTDLEKTDMEKTDLEKINLVEIFKQNLNQIFLEKDKLMDVEIKKKYITELSTHWSAITDMKRNSLYNTIIEIMMNVVKTKLDARFIYPRVRKLIRFLFKNYNSLEICCSKIRTRLETSSKSLKKYGSIVFKTSDTDKMNQQNQAQARVSMKLADPTLFNFDRVMANIKIHSEACDASVTDDRFAKNMASLQTAVGCRVIELLNPLVSNFKQSKRPGHIIQTGAAKTKDVVVIEKPVIGITPKEFLDTLSELRDVCQSDCSNAAYANKFEKQIVVHIKQLYPQVKHGAGTHILRALYARASYRLSDQTNSFTLWLKDVLGHKTYSCVHNYDSILWSDGDMDVIDKNVLKAEPKVDSPVFVTILNTKTGMAHTVDRIKRKRNRSAPAMHLVAMESVDKLVKLGLNPTDKNMRKLGLGSRLLKFYKNYNMEECTLNTDDN
jgi:hypothetical protein